MPTSSFLGQPSSLVLDPAALRLRSERPYLYVADTAQGKIAIVDLSTDTVLDR